jgi:acetyl-CoA carboxylase carboxyltransferase component
MHQKLEAYEKKKAGFQSEGEAEAVKRQHDQGKMMARERVKALPDPGSFQELDLLLSTAEEIFGEGSGKRSVSGAIAGYGEVNGRPIFVWALDAEV